MRALLALTLFAAATPALAKAAPIACRAAKTAVERAVCASPEFVAMDREIAALYDRGLALATPDTRRQMAEHQKGFIKRREGCQWAAHNSAHPGPAVEECIRTTMEARVATLRRFVDNGAK